MKLVNDITETLSLLEQCSVKKTKLESRLNSFLKDYNFAYFTFIDDKLFICEKDDKIQVFIVDDIFIVHDNTNPVIDEIIKLMNRKV